MRKNILGNTGIEVSEIGFGVLPIGKTQYNLPIKKGADLIQYALSKGINFLDTAQYYETYPYIREALSQKKYAPVISSKCLDSSYVEMKLAIKEALCELDLPYIDIFLLHEVRGLNDFRLRSGAWQCLKDAKAAGIIKAMGISTHHVDATFAMAKEEACDLIFPLINKDSLGIRNGINQGKKEDMVSAIEENHKQGKGIFAMKVFGGGNLTGSYIECMDYVSAIKEISAKMIGFSNKEEIDTAIAYAQGSLSKTYRPYIEHKRIRVEQSDCEGCGSCINRCPNHALFINKQGLAEVNHDICITCGYCAPTCPVRAIIMF